MSLSFHVFCITFIGVLWVRFGTCYKCFGSHCMCLEPAGCSTNCTNGFCKNKEFVCTGNIAHCSFDCHEIGSCQDSRFYAASHEFYINCSSSDSCTNVEIYCGMPPELPSQLTASDFNGNMQTCAISASTASIHNSYISCNGDIDRCSIESQPNPPTLATATILDSDFDCSVHTGQCTFNCSYGCYRSTYSCTTPLDTQCQCNGCNHTEAVYVEHTSTTGGTTTTDVREIVDTIHANDTAEADDGDGDNPIFDLTDGQVSNLEILYYIIMGAGTCLVSCICLCVFMVCMVRSSVLPHEEEDDKCNGNPKSPDSEYRVYGAQKQMQTSESNDSVLLDMGAAPSSTNGSSSSKPIPRSADDASSIEYEDNPPNTVSTQESVRPMDQNIAKGCHESSRSSSEMEDMSGELNLNDRQPSPSIVVMEEDDEEEEDDMTTNMDDELSASLSYRDRPLTIKLTKPHNERHKSRLKHHKSRSKPSEDAAPAVVLQQEDKNRLTPNSRMMHPQYSGSPMSPLSAISSSNPDPHEGVGVAMPVYADSIASVDSSEMNLKSKSRTTTEMDLMPQPQPFSTPLMSQQFEQMMANYAANVSRGRSATQFAVMQQQLLFIQQQNHQLQQDRKRSYSASTHSSNSSRPILPRLEMIKPSLHHCHTATVSNPALPVIASDGTHSEDAYVVTPSHTEDTSSKQHGYTASTQSSRVSSSSDDHHHDEESSSEQSDSTCSCSDCVRDQSGNDHETDDAETTTQGTRTDIKMQRLGDNTTNFCSSHGGSSASSSGSSVCNDTQCSCQQYTASCVSSSDRNFGSSSGGSQSAPSDVSSDSESSSSSSYTRSDNETVTTCTVRSEDESHKKMKLKSRHMEKGSKSEVDVYQMDGLDVGSVDTDGASVVMAYKRGNNKTMVIHEDMSTDTHSRQYTEQSGLSTVGSTVDHADHGRFRTVVIHE